MDLLHVFLPLCPHSTFEPPCLGLILQCSSVKVVLPYQSSRWTLAPRWRNIHFSWQACLNIAPLAIKSQTITTSGGQRQRAWYKTVCPWLFCIFINESLRHTHMPLSVNSNSNHWRDCAPQPLHRCRNSNNSRNWKRTMLQKQEYYSIIIIDL